MIDAHVHTWDLAVRDQPWIPAGSPIRRSFGLDHLRSAVAGSAVRQVVLVQVINDPGETADLLDRAGPDPLVAGVVAWVDLTAPDLGDQLVALAARGPLVGIRHQALAEPDPAGWFGQPSVHRGLAVLAAVGLPFDLIIRPAQVEAALSCARGHPGLQLVLDHLGKPPIASGELEPWASGLRALAAEPNVAAKLSGVQTVAAPGWTYDDLRPFTDCALELFGPDRLMFGSDWPVATQAATYGQVVDVAERVCSGLTTAERGAVLGGTAGATYRLG